MGRKNNKIQRKKFFSHPNNKGKIFKRKEAGDTIRKRGNFSLLSTAEFKQIPHCSHGPCLLFGVKEGDSIKQRYFSCAVYRNDAESCDFKAVVGESNEVTATVAKTAKPEKWNYGCIPKKLKGIPKTSTLVFCRECNDVFEEKHKCPSEIVTRKQLQHPSRFLHPLERHTGEAQFFFSEESLQVLLNVVEESNADGVLCVGAPRIFEALKLRKNEKVFMLDVDRRFAHFYPATQYAQYSMLVNYFYHNKALERLSNFFSKCDSVLLICDPPFGVFIEPLMDSLQKLQEMHLHVKGNNSKFFSMILVPFFVGKHILRLDSRYWMSDYRITYENHKEFNKPNKTTVRIFTNLPVAAFNLSNINGYVFCENCERYVHASNKHCFMCQNCTSKDGSKMRHCDRCSRCVKDSYRHCTKCSRCHLQGRCLASNQEE